MSIVELFRAGISMSRIWPRENILKNTFKEGFIIDTIEKAPKVLPPLLCLSLVWAYFGTGYLPEQMQFLPWVTVVIIAMHCVFLPVSLYILLGIKATSKLTGKLLSWYKTICMELHTEAELQPTGISLAKVLRKASADRTLFKKITDIM